MTVRCTNESTAKRTNMSGSYRFKRLGCSVRVGRVCGAFSDPLEAKIS